MGASAKIRVRKPARADGTSQVRLQVVLDREPIFIPLKINWPALLVDEEAGRCLTKLPKEAQSEGYSEALALAQKIFGPEWKQRAEDFSLLMAKALGKANDVFIDDRLDEVRSEEKPVLTKEEFLRAYTTTGSKSDFLVFMDARIEERYRKGTIKRSTWKNHRSTLNKLKDFRARIPFNTLTYKFADDFDAWLKRHGHGDVNTRWQRHKETKTYLAQARLENIKFQDPYKNFKVPTAPSKWKAMSAPELADLEAYYKMCAPRTAHRRILQKFLFSCNSSLRLGDLVAIQYAKLSDRVLRIKTQKGQDKHGKELLLPLTRKALRYLHDAQTENGTEGFFNYADQYENRQLKQIALQLGIETNLHHHIGRETFATNFIRLGGSLAVLQKLMGHSKISMKMKYVHVDEEMKQAEIDRMDALDGEE